MGNKSFIQSGHPYLYLLLALPGATHAAVVGPDTEFFPPAVHQAVTTHSIQLSFELGANESPDNSIPTAPTTRPVLFSGNLGFGSESASLTEITLNIGSSDITGDIFLDSSQQYPILNATLLSKNIDISDFNLITTPNDQDKVFPADPLPLDLFDNSITNLAYEAGLAGGKLQAVASLNTISVLPQLNLHLDIQSLHPGKLLFQNSESNVNGALTDLKLDLIGRGDSIAEIMGSANGKLMTTVGEGKIPVSEIDRLGSNILQETLNLLNPFRKKKEMTELVCGVMRFDIHDGMASSDEGIAIQTEAVNILGSGMINFKTEELDFGFHPENRKKLDFGIGSLAELVRLKGTLAHPEVGASTQGAITAIGSTGVAVATFGLSLLAKGLFSKLSTGDSPCVLALNKTTDNPDFGTSSEQLESGIEEVPELGHDLNDINTDQGKNQ